MSLQLNLVSVIKTTALPEKRLVNASYIHTCLHLTNIPESTRLDTVALQTPDGLQGFIVKAVLLTLYLISS